MKCYKSHVKKIKSGEITEAKRQMENKRIDNARVALNAYINHYENKVKTMKGSGIRKKTKRWKCNIFNDPKKLLQKIGIDCW